MSKRTQKTNSMNFFSTIRLRDLTLRTELWYRLRNSIVRLRVYQEIGLLSTWAAVRLVEQDCYSLNVIQKNGCCLWLFQKEDGS